MAIHEHEVDRRTLFKAGFKAGLGGSVAAVVGTELAFPGTADATPSAEFPWIIDCDAWGARPPSAPIQITGNTTDKIILHHMAFPNVTDYSRDHAVQLAKDCQNLHMDTNGWADTGQHFTVSRGGYVLEGRHRSLETLDAGGHQVIAAHCPGENGNAIGIENEGTYITETPPLALVDSLVQLCVAVCRQFGLYAWDIFGHWDFYTTDCPASRSTRSSRWCVRGSGPRWVRRGATSRPAGGRTSGGSSTVRSSRWPSTCSRTPGTTWRPTASSAPT